ncbi:VOC family protein [Streptacidiphilus sp. PAMC 29251]
MGSTTPAPDGMRLASVVLNVFDLERSTDFYTGLLGLRVTLAEPTAALLVGADGSELYLRSLGPRAPHLPSGVGVHCAIWTAASEVELRRCEQFLKDRDAHTVTERADGFVWVEGRDPNGVPVVITHPGPDQAARKDIISRVYAW